MRDDVKEQEKVFLPSNILTGNTSYRVFLYGFLIEESHAASVSEIGVKHIIAYMIHLAWRFVVDAELSLGLPDRLNNLCAILSKKFAYTPSIEEIELELENQSYKGVVDDIKPVFFRFLANWPNEIFAPYTIFQKNGNVFVRMKRAWGDYCLLHYDKCKRLYDEGLQRYLLKRNKDVARVREALQEKFIEQERKKIELNDELPPIDGITAENIEALEQIPFDFLYKSNGFCDCPAVLSLKYNPPEECFSVGDILYVNQGKRKYLVELTKYIVDSQTRIISLFNFYLKKPQIPQNVCLGMPLGFLIQSFIQEYIDRALLKISLLPKSQQDYRKRKVELFSIIFDSRKENFSSFEEIAQKQGVSKQRVAQILTGDDEFGLSSCVNILNGKNESNDFNVNPILFSALLELQLSDSNAYPLDYFCSRFGVIDKKTKIFIMRVTEWKAYSSVGFIGPIVMRNGKPLMVAKALSEAKRFMDEKVLPISIERDLVSYFQENYDYDNETISATCDLIRYSDYFVVSNGVCGEKLYALKWEKLTTVASRLARILYEQGEPMRIKDVYSIYNAKAAEFGLHFENSPDWFTYRSHPYIVPQGKTGLWSFSLGGKNGLEKKKNAKNAVEAFVKERIGEIHFKDVLCYMRENGFHQTENTIRAYLHEMCRVVRFQSDVFVIKEKGDKAKEKNARRKVTSNAIPIFVKTIKRLGGKASVRELRDAYEKEIGNAILDVTARFILAKNAEFCIEKNEYGSISVSLADEQCGEERGIAEKEKYTEQIRRRVVEILKSEPKHCKRLRLIYNEVNGFVPKGKRTNVVYSIIKKMNEVETYLIDGKKYLRLKE